MGRSFHWTDAHAVFLPEIDAEHRNIFRAGSSIDHALMAGMRVPQIRELMRAAVSAIDDHFAHEERLMRESRFSGFEWHKRQHDAARKRVKAFGRRVEAGEKQAAREMLDYLGPWMRDHVGLADRMMASYIRNRQRVRSAA